MHRSSRPFRSTRVTKPFAVLHSPPKMRQSLSASVVFPLIMTVVIMGMFGHVPVVSGDPVQDDPARTSLGNTQESFGGMSVKSVDMVPGDVELHGSIMCEIPKPSWIDSAADEADVCKATAAAASTDAGPTHLDSDSAVASSSRTAGDDAGDTDSTSHSSDGENTFEHTDQGDAEAGGGSTRNSWASDRMTSPLKVGDTMTIDHRLTSTDGGSAIVLSQEGSIHFQQSPSSAFASETSHGARGNGSDGQDSELNDKVTRIFDAEGQKVAQVSEMRAAYNRFREMHGSAEGVALREKKGPLGWYHRKRARRFEKLGANMGKVRMTVSNRGCVEVMVDDTRVVSRSGSFKAEWMNRFPWRRRRSDDYEIHATDDGLQVRLGDKAVWDVRAAKHTETDRTAAMVGDEAPLPPGERTVWGIKAFDIFD